MSCGDTADHAATDADEHQDAAVEDAAAGSADQGEGLAWYGDSAYGTGELRGAIERAGHDAVIKPKPVQPAVVGGFTFDDFTVDEGAGTVTCPAGQTRPISPTRTVTFSSWCQDCPLRARCTTAKAGRTMVLHERDDLLRAARADWAAEPRFTRGLPDLPAQRRTHRLPGRHPERAADQAALPRHHQEQRLAQVPHRRTEPAQPRRPWSYPR